MNFKKQKRWRSHYFVLCSLLFLLCSLTACLDSPLRKRTSWFRYVAYIKSNRALAFQDRWIRYGVTHLNLWFYNPDAEGVLVTQASFEEQEKILRKAHFHGISVLASLGGGIINGDQQKWWNQIATDEGTSIVIEAVLQLCDRLPFDGIDLDLEGRSIPPHFDAFVQRLASALKERKLLFTLAAGRWVTAPHLCDESLALFDFLNIMSYNYSGKHSLVPSEHASYIDSMNEMSFWIGQRKIDPKKCVLGIPYYAYIWEFDEEGNRTDCYTKTYSVAKALYPDIIGKYDYYTMKKEDGGKRILSMNSLKTIENKFQLALHYGGLMCWTLENDVENEGYSLSALIFSLRQRYLF